MRNRNKHKQITPKGDNFSCLTTFNQVTQPRYMWSDTSYDTYA